MTLANRIHKYVPRRALSGLATIAAMFLAAADLQAQTDNFNYTAPPLAAGWETSISANYPGLLSSPADGLGGQALRMQVTNQIPVPPALTAGADLQNTARIIALRTNQIYTNFFVAADILTWDTNWGKVFDSTYFDPASATSDHLGMTNQVYLGLIAHATHARTNSSNYDPNVPYGRPDGLGLTIDIHRFGGGDPNGSRGVVNIVYFKDGQPNAGTVALQGDLSITPGHSYRLTFTGTNMLNQFDTPTNAVYVGRIYDLLDLTRPLVTVSCSPIPGGGFAYSGYSGLIAITKNIPCMADVTYDNFVASENPPTSVSLPATPYGLAGVPQVVSRSPASWTNFYPASAGINFNAATFNANTISTSDIRLYLNGVNVTSGLTFGSNPTNRTVSFSGLRSNIMYDARIELANQLGQKNTNTWTFDTFSDDYLASTACRNIECEDIDFNGSFIDYPSPSGFTWATTYAKHRLTDGNLNVSYPWSGAINQGPAGYVNQLAVNAATNGGVGDFNDTETGSPLKLREADYRPINFGNNQGCDDYQYYGFRPDGSGAMAIDYYTVFDTQRKKYSDVNPDLKEYLVRRNQGGDWYKYTRSFFYSTNYYNVYLRAGCDLAAPYQLGQMTPAGMSIPTATNVLGTFNLTAAFARSNFRYFPLLDSNGKLAVVNLSGTNTLRLLMNCPNDEKVTRSSMLNYMAFVPAMLLESSATVDGTYTIETAATVELGSGHITVPQNGPRFYRLRTVGTARPNITSFNLVGSNIELTYQ